MTCSSSTGQAAARTSTSVVSSMPLFMAYCPDYPTALPSVTGTEAGAGRTAEEGEGGGDTYAKRLSVRQKHWARAQEDKQAGRLCESCLP